MKSKAFFISFDTLVFQSKYETSAFAIGKAAEPRLSKHLFKRFSCVSDKTIFCKFFGTGAIRLSSSSLSGDATGVFAISSIL